MVFNHCVNIFLKKKQVDIHSVGTYNSGTQTGANEMAYTYAMGAWYKSDDGGLSWTRTRFTNKKKPKQFG
jgi:hypothetical protein